jgi:hypothetical protein
VDKLLTFVVNANTGTALDIPVIVVVVDWTELSFVKTKDETVVII